MMNPRGFVGRNSLSGFFLYAKMSSTQIRKFGMEEESENEDIIEYESDKSDMEKEESDNDAMIDRGSEDIGDVERDKTEMLDGGRRGE
jgi:hypothetical protein